MKIITILVDDDDAAHAGRKQADKEAVINGADPRQHIDAYGRAMVGVHHLISVVDVTDAEVIEHKGLGIKQLAPFALKGRRL